MIRLSNLGAYAMLPVRVLHEATHVLAGFPWAHDIAVDVTRDRLTTSIVFKDKTPAWAVFLTHLAPSLVGALAAVGLLTAAVTGRFEVVVTTPLDALWIALCAWAWWAYSWPSPADRNVARVTEPAEGRTG